METYKRKTDYSQTQGTQEEIAAFGNLLLHFKSKTKNETLVNERIVMEDNRNRHVVIWGKMSDCERGPVTKNTCKQKQHDLPKAAPREKRN